MNDEQLKRIAHDTITKLKERGELLVPLSCSICGDTTGGGPIAHHPSYDKPLDIQWLCRSCHQKIHNKLSPPKPKTITEKYRLHLRILKWLNNREYKDYWQEYHREKIIRMKALKEVST